MYNLRLIGRQNYSDLNINARIFLNQNNSLRLSVYAFSFNCSSKIKNKFAILFLNRYISHIALVYIC